MTPSARVQAAIELLDAIIGAAQSRGAPADRLISQYFKQRRYAGSKDRRAVRELVYRAIRACGPIPDSGRAAMLRLGAEDPAIAPLFDGSSHAPAPIVRGEPAADGGIAPDWLIEKLGASGVQGEELRALLERAPLDVRVNAIKADRTTIELPIAGENLAAAQGLRFATGTQVEQWEAYRDGLIEVQDHASQLACGALDVSPGETVIDLCAGAGGKTLGLAAMMQNDGKLLACDVDRARLSRLAPRANRAGAGMIETLLLNPGQELEALSAWEGQADAVLVDAPCSGTGTWRRKPEAKWRLDDRQLARYAQAQDRLLDIASKLVRAGGPIGFITCSLLDQEGKDRASAFLERYPVWRAERPVIPLGREHGEGIRLTPSHDGTDGFFLAKLVSAC